MAMRAIILGISFFLLTQTTYAETNGVAGFLQNPIWHTPITYYEGDTVRIYAALMNSSSADVTGVVRFLVNNTAVGSRSFTMRAQDTVITVWHDWKATEGAHVFSAKITDTKFSSQTQDSVIAPKVVTDSPSITATTSIKKIVAETQPSETEISSSTQTFGETLDSATVALRNKLEDAKKDIEVKMENQRGRVAGTSTTWTGDDSSSESKTDNNAVQAISSKTNFLHKTLLFLLGIARGILSFFIGALNNPVWTAIALVVVFMFFMKIIEQGFRFFSRRR